MIFIYDANKIDLTPMSDQCPNVPMCFVRFVLSLGASKYLFL